MKKPTLKLATWADYADVVNQRMTILRTFGYLEVESLPSPVRCFFAIQLEFDDLQPETHLHLRLQDYEGTVVADESLAIQPHRTLTDRYLSQMVGLFQFEAKKHEYSLKILNKDTGELIGELALPIVTLAQKTAAL